MLLSNDKIIFQGHFEIKSNTLNFNTITVSYRLYYLFGIRLAQNLDKWNETPGLDGGKVDMDAIIQKKVHLKNNLIPENYTETPAYF